MTERYDMADIPGAWEPVVLECAAYTVARRPMVLLGPPGTGKTMIARRLTGLLRLDEHAQRWLSAEYDGMFQNGIARVVEPPFRAPHHTISTAAMVGGSQQALQIGDHRAVLKLPRVRITRAGEVDLARFGVLMLDEVIEFSIATITALSERLRTMGDTAPVIVATASRCPCGWFQSTVRECTCSQGARDRWATRLAFVQRLLGINLCVDVAPLSPSNLRESGRCRSTAEIREAVSRG